MNIMWAATFSHILKGIIGKMLFKMAQGLKHFMQATINMNMFVSRKSTQRINNDSNANE